ncbi:MAG TPA: HupE/UreJ family protein [Devosia sp.]|nr:HupE/UreJ family protein [Devosia sp.]
MSSVGRTIVFLLVALVAFLPARAGAHDVPDQVTVLTFIKPEAGVLSVVMRVPLSSLRDVDIPLTANGFLDIANAGTALEHASQLWITDFVKFYENGTLLPKPAIAGARISLADDRSFSSHEQALASITGPPLPSSTEMQWEAGLLDIAYTYPIVSPASDFTIDPQFSRLGVEVKAMLRFLGPDGSDRVFDVHPSDGPVALNPNLRQTAQLFARLGVTSLLTNIEHLLFLIALALPFARLRPIMVLAATFMVGQTLSLAGSAYGFAPHTLWFPHLRETLMAVSIFYLAIENIFGARLERRWWAALGFGLVHGFALAIPLAENTQFAGDHRLTAVLSFDIGVGFGALVAMGATLAAVLLMLNRPRTRRIGIIVVSGLIAHSAWDWMLERGAALARFPLPTLDALAASGALWWIMASVATAGLLWVVSILRPDLLSTEPRNAGGDMARIPATVQPPREQ